MNTRETLKSLGAFRRPGRDNNPHTGQTTTKKLRARIADWKVMTGRPDFKANDGPNPGFHCPGSLK